MKNLKDTLIIKEDKKSTFIPFDDAMFSMVVVSEGEETIAYLFKNLKEIQSLYEDWGGYDDDDISNICSETDKLKKNQSYINFSSNKEYEIITALK